MTAPTWRDDVTLASAVATHLFAVVGLETAAIVHRRARNSAARCAPRAH